MRVAVEVLHARATWTLNVVESGSRADGVQISVRPCQWNEPSTEGVIENAFSAVSCWTSLLKATLIGGQRQGLAVRRQAADTDRVRGRDAVHHRRVVEDRAEDGEPDEGRDEPKEPARRHPAQGNGSFTGQDDSTAPILANL